MPYHPVLVYPYFSKVRVSGSEVKNVIRKLTKGEFQSEGNIKKDQ